MLWDILVGFAAGIFGSMGVGGGTVLLLYLTVFAGFSQLSAQGINLVFFLPTALCALLVHLKNGFVKWRSAVAAILFGIPGVFIGFYLAGLLDKELLRTIFALFLLFIGTRELLAKK